MRLESCDSCTRCVGCQRRVCFVETPSPGEGDGLCVDCWLVETPEEMEVPC